MKSGCRVSLRESFARVALVAKQASNHLINPKVYRIDPPQIKIEPQHDSMTGIDAFHLLNALYEHRRE
jgi:hypothetical protein